MQSTTKDHRRFCMLPPAIARLLPDLEKSDMAVLIVLCGARDWQTDQVSMGQRLIAQQAGLSDDRLVADALKRLVRLGLIETVKPAARGRGGRGVWRVVFDDPAESPAAAETADEYRNGSGINEDEIPEPVRVLETRNHYCNNREYRNHSGISDAQNPEPFRHSEAQIPEQIPEPFRHVLETRNINTLSRAGEEPAIGGDRWPPGASRAPSLGQPPIEPATLAAALAAFDRWAAKPPSVGRGFALSPANNEHAPILAMLCALADSSPIPRAGGPVDRGQLVPQAIDALIGRGMAFKSPAYAAGCVRNLLGDWASGASSPEKSSNGQRINHSAQRAGNLAEAMKRAASKGALA